MTALNLFKHYNKPTYFGWAVASLLIKAEKLQDDSSARISVPLAERMLAKFISDQKNQVEDNILILYLETLKKQVSRFENCNICFFPCKCESYVKSSHL